MKEWISVCAWKDQQPKSISRTPIHAKPEHKPKDQPPSWCQADSGKSSSEVNSANQYHSLTPHANRVIQADRTWIHSRDSDVAAVDVIVVAAAAKVISHSMHSSNSNGNKDVYSATHHKLSCHPIDFDKTGFHVDGDGGCWIGTARSCHYPTWCRSPHVIQLPNTTPGIHRTPDVKDIFCFTWAIFLLHLMWWSAKHECSSMLFPSPLPVGRLIVAVVVILINVK